MMEFFEKILPADGLEDTNISLHTLLGTQTGLYYLT